MHFYWRQIFALDFIEHFCTGFLENLLTNVCIKILRFKFMSFEKRLKDNKILELFLKLEKVNLDHSILYRDIFLRNIKRVKASYAKVAVL